VRRQPRSGQAGNRPASARGASYGEVTPKRPSGREGGEPGAGRFPVFIAALLALSAGCGPHGEAGGDDARARFTVTGDAEIIAKVIVNCGDCDWANTGSEARVVAVTLDARPPMHVPVVRSGLAEYRVLLGTVASGEHSVTVIEDPNLTAPSLRGKAPSAYPIEIVQVPVTAANYQAVSLAPFIYARADTVGRFTDVPLLMWYETELTARGTRFRYSVVFSNEDGGTPADRLMATWGRTTDIEYVYSVEVDANDAILSEDMQGPKHEILPFKGKREGQHPLLWVSTENNMVLDHGATTVRYAPAPMAMDLKDASREVVMDAHAWTYEVMTKELMREGKIVADAPPGQGTIPDPRRYVFLEGCGEAGNNAIAVSVNVAGVWWPSDRGVTEYRIVRDGCFRAAIPLPGTAGAGDVRAVRVQAFARKDKRANTPSRFTRLNRVFALNERFEPGQDVLRWTGTAVLRPGGPPFEMPVR
jgi:hypothetical protein